MEKIVFILGIPLVIPVKLYLYRNLPFSVSHGVNISTSYSTIIPSSKYIGIRSDKSIHCMMDDFLGCKIISDNTHLCDTSVSYSLAVKLK